MAATQPMADVRSVARHFEPIAGAHRNRASTGEPRFIGSPRSDAADAGEAEWDDEYDADTDDERCEK